MIIFTLTDVADKCASKNDFGLDRIEYTEAVGYRLAVSPTAIQFTRRVRMPRYCRALESRLI